MKKIILIVFLFLFVLVGCNNMMNTPTKKVEEFLNKYQRLDSEVTNQLDDVTNESINNFNESQKNKYKEAMKNQYKDLTYTIKEEMIDGNTATVTVEIEVYDYNKILTNVEDYYTKNPNEFKNKSGEIDLIKYIDYKIEKLMSPKERIKYTLYLTLNKNKKNWILNDITETDRQKIAGLYSN